MTDITKELAETLRELRTKFDARENLTWTMVDVDAILDRYDDACKQMPNEDDMAIVDDILERYAEPFMTPEKPKMTINLKDYEGKLVVASLRDGWMVVDTVSATEEYNGIPYIIKGRHYSNDGRCLEECGHDIKSITLADEDPEPTMTNCVVEGEPPNGCSAWNIWYEEFGSRGILNNLKISSVDYNPTPRPEPIITRVEVITDNGRVYTNWEKDNKITTSLQDEGRTLKIFVTTNTKEPKMSITKPPFYYNLTPGDKTMYTVAEDEVSKQWANALSVLIEELSPHSSLSLWGYEGETPTPEKVVEYLRGLIKYREQRAADNELDECCEWLKKNTGNHMAIEFLRTARRPQPTLKSQALKDFETVRKNSDLLPEILDSIENALKSIPENV